MIRVHTKIGWLGEIILESMSLQLKYNNPYEGLPLISTIGRSLIINSSNVLVLKCKDITQARLIDKTIVPKILLNYACAVNQLGWTRYPCKEIEKALTLEEANEIVKTYGPIRLVPDKEIVLFKCNDNSIALEYQVPLIYNCFGDVYIIIPDLNGAFAKRLDIILPDITFTENDFYLFGSKNKRAI